MTMRVVALGQDDYWLSAVYRATAGWAGKPKTVKCLGSLQKCIPSLPKPDIKSVVLVDASGQGSMEEIVTALRSHGWKYVIVVAADPNAKEAAAILRKDPEYDYWEKTYDEEVIRNQVRASFEEITAKERSGKTKRKTPKR